jgi:hypothetical protein
LTLQNARVLHLLLQVEVSCVLELLRKLRRGDHLVAQVLKLLELLVVLVVVVIVASLHLHLLHAPL